MTRTRRRLIAAIHRYRTRRRFARVLRAYGYEPTRQLVNMSMDYEADANPNVVIREGWKP